MMLTILGGTYHEVCLAPAWNKLYGSGFRAAVALVDIVDDGIHFFTYASSHDLKELRRYAEQLGIAITIYPRDASIEWRKRRWIGQSSG